jgi:hypothetical protein
MLRHLKRRPSRNNLIASGLDCGSQLAKIVYSNWRASSFGLMLLYGRPLLFLAVGSSKLFSERLAGGPSLLQRGRSGEMSPLFLAEMSRCPVNICLPFCSRSLSGFDFQDCESQILSGWS